MIPNKTTRNTNQRIKILNYLRSVKTHPTAEMVYQGVKQDLPAISLGTVYRNLNLLAEQGDILKLEINGEYHFDGDTCGHQHLICDECGRIYDLMQEEISKFAMDRVRSRYFEPTCVNITFKGICKQCKGVHNETKS